MIGARLTQIRGSRSQGEMAELLAVHKNTYARWERDEREIGAEGLAALVAQGWNVNWLLTGEGPERVDDVVGDPSQDLSEEALNIALEITDDIIRKVGARYVPRTSYAKLLRLMYQGITQGLPVADVHDIGEEAVRKAVSGTGGAGDVGEAGVGRAGQGGRR